jgi:DNA-binding transcriptional ArsR family regulator
MSDGPHIAAIAGLIGDRARAEILTALMGGQALTATELAGAASVTKQTASAHLAKLLEARLVAVQSQGRHRYFRLADRDVAELIEVLTGVAFRAGAVRLRTGPREPALRKARVCYDHLAGDMGVELLEGMVKRRYLRHHNGAIDLTAKGRVFCGEWNLPAKVAPGERRLLCRPCLDWSARRNHLAGTLGAAILERCYELRWAKRERGSRVVVFTPAGERALREHFG